MKSHQTKKRFNRFVETTEAARAARDADPNLMALYFAFLPSGRIRGKSKFVTDKYGNRVLRGSGVEAKV